MQINSIPHSTRVSHLICSCTHLLTFLITFSITSSCVERERDSLGAPPSIHKTLGGSALSDFSRQTPWVNTRAVYNSLLCLNRQMKSPRLAIIKKAAQGLVFESERGNWITYLGMRTSQSYGPLRIIRASKSLPGFHKKLIDWPLHSFYYSVWQFKIHKLPF